MTVVELGMRADEEFAIRGLFKPTAFLLSYFPTHISDLNIPAKLCSSEGMVRKLWKNLPHLFTDALLHVG